MGEIPGGGGKRKSGFTEKKKKKKRVLENGSIVNNEKWRKANWKIGAKKKFELKSFVSFSTRFKIPKYHCLKQQDHFSLPTKSFRINGNCLFTTPTLM